MSTEAVQLISLTLFAVVISLLFALGTLTAARATARARPRRLRENRREDVRS